MKSYRGLRIARWMKYVAVAALVGCFHVSSVPSVAQTQTQGQNDVYNSGFGQAGSSAFIDADTFQGGGQGSDLCDTIYKILTGSFGITYPAQGAVVDARGISGAALACTQGSPWFETGKSYANVPSTILLPAGIIYISLGWILPEGTKIIGEGAGGVTTTTEAFTSVTRLVACTTGNSCNAAFTGSAMIQMGNSGCQNNTCHSVSIEDVALDGQGIPSLDGIDNSNSQELSYVNRVNLYGVLGFGLKLGSGAQNSGPYSNIVFNSASASAAACVQILNVSTQGVHGLTCESNPDSQVAIYLDGSNNTLEDVRIVGFYDGVRIGSQAVAKSDVLRNIFGDTSPSGPTTPVHVIHITPQPLNVSDLVIMGVGNAFEGSTTTIYDQLTSTPGLTLTDHYIGMYAVGESAQIGSGNLAYSRFTTSPNAATWGAGNGDESGNCAVTGSLYSNMTAGQPGSNNPLWLCAGGGTWQAVQPLP